MAQETNSLLFIPDISGFTDFVNATEIEHSRYIIAELLEIIIESNDLDLVVSEIEGDAVLFYKYQSVPTLEETVRLAKKMFLAFHTFLNRFNNERICDCQACRSASQLALKIIIHSGEISLIQVRNFKKPYGADVILLHRLLKNDIKESEYLLITQAHLQNYGGEEVLDTFDWVEKRKGEGTYEIGVVPYLYTPFAPLRARIGRANEIEEFQRLDRFIQDDVLICKPIDEVYEMVSNLRLRHKWNKQVKDLIFDPTKLNRVGTHHVCVLPLGKLDFETVKVKAEDGNKTYAERVSAPPIVKEMAQVFDLEPEDKGTRVSLQVHYEPREGLGKLLTPLFILNTRTSIKKLLKDLKQACEVEGLG